MCTLLLRLAGAMQSWGTEDRFSVRFAGREPSKSGVIGLVCAALGRPRNESVDDLAGLRMGVRVDAEGVVLRDYHTAGGAHGLRQTYGVLRSSGTLSHDAVPSSRYYIAGADFLVGLEGPIQQLRLIEDAVRLPVWQLFLGRKALVPGVPCTSRSRAVSVPAYGSKTPCRRSPGRATCCPAPLTRRLRFAL